MCNMDTSLILIRTFNLKSPSKQTLVDLEVLVVSIAYHIYHIYHRIIYQCKCHIVLVGKVPHQAL